MCVETPGSKLSNCGSEMSQRERMEDADAPCACKSFKKMRRASDAMGALLLLLLLLLL